MTRRSIMLVPADRPDLLREAVAEDPSAVCLDVAWRIHPARKQEAYAQVAAQAEGVVHTTEVMVLLGPETLEVDVAHCVHPPITVVVLAAQTPGTVSALDAMLTEQEDQLGLARGSVKALLLLDTPQALWRARDLARASPRVEGLIFGACDLAVEFARSADDGPSFMAGPQPGWPVPEYTFSRMATVAAAARVPLYGMLGTSLAPEAADEARLREACRMAKEWGFTGAMTTHRAGVRAARALE